MKVFIGRNAYDEPIPDDTHICVEASIHCSGRTKTPCPFCIKVPARFDWRMYLKHLREKLMEIPDGELR